MKYLRFNRKKPYFTNIYFKEGSDFLMLNILRNFYHSYVSFSYLKVGFKPYTF